VKITKDKGKAPMELAKDAQLLKEFEDIMININKYYEAINEKIKLIEEIVIDPRVNLRKAREIITHFYETIETQEDLFKKDTKKVQTELSKLSFHPQMSQGNASNPIS